MSWFSDALGKANSWVVNQTGGKLNLDPTQAKWSWGQQAPKEQVEQVAGKLNIDDPMREMQWRESQAKRYLRGYDPDPENYRGVPTAEKQKSAFQAALTRAAESNANALAGLGGRGLMGGADAARFAIESAENTENKLANIANQMAFDEYQSKVAERNQNLDRRLGMAGDWLEKQDERTRAIREGWQGKLGEFGKALTEGGGAGAALWGGNELARKNIKDWKL
jgi:hypothetical protein